ncbi:MAG: Nramp family divalent metal transporter [Pirellula sp.]
MNPAKWLAIIGPGAIVASLTIGAGELVFSSRGGALFGYDLLGFFFLICFLKWALVLITARHIVLTGAHPTQRWCEMPGPRGWLVWVFLLLAVVAFPIWVGFHAGTIGTLIASLVEQLGLVDPGPAGGHLFYGLAVLLLVMVLVRTGSYQRLEGIQIGIVGVMLACVTASLIMLNPNWKELVEGMFSFRVLEYPDWVPSKYPDLAKRPIWMELATYVGVLGGSGYDYLAYVSFLREKQWGASSGPILTRAELESISHDRTHPHRKWLWVPVVDATLSFAIVFFFSAVFVACGTIVLRPTHQIPDGTDLLTLQAKFVESGSEWMRPLYFVGAFLAMFGTLYGTIEVAPTVAREFARALHPLEIDQRKLHRWVTNWVGCGGAAVLLWSLVSVKFSGTAKPPGLIAILDPANLFTGVLACGWITCLACWTELKFMPSQLRAPWWLILVNSLSCVVFTALGVKAYWDYGGPSALLILLATLVVGWIAAWLHQNVRH